MVAEANVLGDTSQSVSRDDGLSKGGTWCWRAYNQTRRLLLCPCGTCTESGAASWSSVSVIAPWYWFLSRIPMNLPLPTYLINQSMTMIRSSSPFRLPCPDLHVGKRHRPRIYAIVKFLQTIETAALIKIYLPDPHHGPWSAVLCRDCRGSHDTDEIPDRPLQGTMSNDEIEEIGFDK